MALFVKVMKLLMMQKFAILASRTLSMTMEAIASNALTLSV
jgi:hypothetical protein